MSVSVRFAERHGVLALGDFHRLDGVLRHVEAAHRPQPDPRLCKRIDAHASLRFVLNTVGGRLPVLHVFCRPVGMLAEVSISSTTSAQERIVRNSVGSIVAEVRKEAFGIRGDLDKISSCKRRGDALVKQIVRSQPNRLTESNII